VVGFVLGMVNFFVGARGGRLCSASTGRKESGNLARGYFAEIINNPVGPVLLQCTGVVAVDAEHECEASRPSGLYTGDGILDDSCALRT